MLITLSCKSLLLCVVCLLVHLLSSSRVSCMSDLSLSNKQAKRLTIVIGNKAYSSWSLRSWLGVRYVHGNRSDFDEVLCPLAGAGASKEKLSQAKQIMLQYSPTGKVPVLIDHELDISICESLAILLHLAELFPDYKLLPVDLPSKSLCLSACAEMHSGFSALRQHFSMNCLMVAKVHGQRVLESNEDVRNDIQRLCELISGLKATYGAESASGHLFNHFTVADCMFAPVAIRFNTYCPDYRSDIFDKYPVAVEYFQSLYRNTMVQEWIAEARLEGPSLKIAKYEEFSDDFLQL